MGQNLETYPTLVRLLDNSPTLREGGKVAMTRLVTRFYSAYRVKV
jgi:hypothetical protein